ncbi:hypothetical protein BU17DRAFT_87487 [Hysterangium stoloniferum]|nr:hypothetical protein BU17DRAFT_87487 [Hysterangium stoloniferum]
MTTRSSSSSTTQPIRVFALFIGIDRYQSTFIHPLNGAVADAQEMYMFMSKTYNLHSSDHRINRCDPILIYYAGHGDRVPAPNGWHAPDGMVETIVPYDTWTMNGEIGNMISDWGLGDLLASLAQNKGNNITVILDCCHSNSGTRGISEGGQFTDRSARVRGILPPSQDKDILNQFTSGLTSQFRCNQGSHDPDTHIILAACGSADQAREHRGRGCFTDALLRTLADIDLKKVTFAELMVLLPTLPLNQSPHCRGRNQGRFLFSTNILDKSIIPVIKGPNNELKLVAGWAQTVSPRDVFQVATIDEEPLGTFIPYRILQSYTILIPDRDSMNTSTFPRQARARRALAPLPQHPFGVYFSTSFDDLFVRSVEANSGHRIQRVGKTSADMLVDTEHDEAVFTLILRRLNHEERLNPRTQVHHQEVLVVLLNAARVHWHLCRDVNDENDVSIEFFALEQLPTSADEGSNPRWGPIKPIRNLVENGTVDITVGRKGFCYGMKLINKTNVDFYVYGHYFDVTSLKSETEYDISATGTGHGKIDIPLRRSGELPIGYGASGCDPFEFERSASVPVECGFLKFFLTTANLNHSPISLSPFEQHMNTRGLVSRKPEILRTCLLKIVGRYPP